MVTYTPEAVLHGDAPGPWGAATLVTYTERDVLLYAVGIGCSDMRFVFEKDADFAAFPTFPIRWGGLGAGAEDAALPPSPGPLTIDAERMLEVLAPLPRAGTVEVRSRLIAAHPRGKGNALVEREAEVSDGAGGVYVRMVSGAFRRGVERLGDIAPFQGRGLSRSAKLVMPDRQPDIDVTTEIAANQALIYRLSGDYNPLHIANSAAAFGGFRAPILHGLCTYGHCARLLLQAVCANDVRRFLTLKVRFSSPVYPGDTLRVVGWHDGPGRVIFEARVAEQIVVSNAAFTYR